MTLGGLTQPVKFLGTSATNRCERADNSRSNSGLPPYPSSKVSQSNFRPFSTARSYNSRAIFHLGRYVMSSGMPASRQRSRSSDQDSGRNSSPSSRQWKPSRA